MPFATRAIQISIEPPTKRRLDINRFVPFFLATISSKINANASRVLMKRYDLGVTEWRILCMLAIEPEATPGRISGMVGLDKSSISRALKNLEARGCVRVDVDPAHRRRQFVSLTPDGEALHQDIVGGVLVREDILLTGFSPDERDVLIDYLQRMLANVPLVFAHQRQRDREDGLAEDGLAEVEAED